jgi:plastocyanin domain-containing protein
MPERLIPSFLLLFTALVACGPSAVEPPSDGRRSIAVSVGASGYTPAEITAAPGEPIRVLFTRTSDEGCGQQVVFPEQELRADLPLGQPVPLDLTVPESGRVRFTCGMDMYEGAIVVR